MPEFSTVLPMIWGDDSVLVLASDGNVIGWDLNESNVFRWEFQIEKINNECRMSPDGRRLLIHPYHGKSFLCNARTGADRIELSELQISDRCRSADWSHDGEQIAMGTETGGLSVFESERGTKVWQDRVDCLFARSIVFSNDGTRLAVGGFDNTIRVWNLSQTEASPLVLTGRLGVIGCFAFTPNDKTLVSGSLNGSICEWSLADEKLIRKLR